VFLILNTWLILTLVLVANAKIECGLCKKKLKITLSFTIRHQNHIKCACLLTIYRKRPKGLSQKGGTKEAGFYDGDERHQEELVTEAKRTR